MLKEKLMNDLKEAMKEKNEIKKRKIKGNIRLAKRC